ncbi:hypothetical protein XANCAGTX0491_004725 [Xanthoria calcicola]
MRREPIVFDCGCFDRSTEAAAASDIPSEFLAERIHSVTHSFGWHQEDDFSHVFWLHTLCKNLELVQGTDGKLAIQDPRGSQPSQEGDGTWKRSGIFLRWKQSTVGNGDASEVDMIIFSPTLSLQKNLESLVKRPHWRQALEDPFCLLVVVLDNLFRQVDEAIAKVHNVLRAVEHVRHSCAGTPDKANTSQRVLESSANGATGAMFNFVAMYNIAKHVIHLKESSSAAYLAACEVAAAHRSLTLPPKQLKRKAMGEAVQNLIQHKLTLLEGCKLRVQSLDSRAQNMTNLAFNTVNQQDSQTMKADSQSMKVIATVTMIFLPAATIGSIFGSQFFNFNSDSHRIMMSVDFKFFWAVTIPLTFLVFGVYLLWRWIKANEARRDGKNVASQKIST